MPQQRLTLVVLVALLTAGLVVFWGSRPLWAVQDVPVVAHTDEPVAADPHPSQTRRGARIWARRAGFVARHDLARPEVDGVPVALTSDLIRPRAQRMLPDFAVDAVLPVPDEAPFPRGAATRALGELLLAEDAASSETDRLESAFREAARQARLDPTELSVVDDPWRAVLVLEAERRRALATRTADSATGEWLYGLAAALIQAQPTAAAADHARLVLLDVLADSQWDTADAHRLVEASLEALVHSDDGLVRAVALRHIEEATGYAEELLPALAATWSDEAPDPWLAAAAADHAVAAGDPTATRTWLERLRRAVDRTCDVGLDKPLCRAWRLELRWSEAQLNATTGNEPLLAEDRAMTAAWRCQIWRRPLGDGELTLEPLDGGWRIVTQRGDADARFASDCLVFELDGVEPEAVGRIVLQQ